MHARLLVAFGAVGSLALSAAAQQAPSRAPSRVPAGDSVRARQPFVVARDSVRVRSTVANEAELMRVINELREREARLLRELMLTSEAEQMARRKLVEELQGVSREAFTVMSVIESRCLDQRGAASSGYLGINITTEMELLDRSTLLGKSVITSVEPGSPAERAGLTSGDRLLAIGGRDARETLPELSDLLQPGRRVLVKVERAGAPLEVAVVAGVRPQYYKVESCPSFERALQPLRMGAVGRVWMTDTIDASGNRYVFVTPAPSVAAVAPTPPAVPAAATPTPPPTPRMSPTPPTAPMAWGPSVTSGSAVSYFGGAQFRALDDDWRSVLGLKDGTQGVFVNEIAPGSAAAQAGLRVGDVITHVNDAAATSPFVVSRLIGVSEGSRATLKILRARAPRTITLEWDRR